MPPRDGTRNARKRTLPRSLRVALQQQVEGLEAVGDVLARVEPVDAHDRLHVFGRFERLAVLLERRRGAQRRRAPRVERDRVGPDERGLAQVLDLALSLQHPGGSPQVGAAGSKECRNGGFGLEDDAVVGQQAGADPAHDRIGQLAPGGGARPGDVDEVLQGGRGARAARIMRGAV